MVPYQCCLRSNVVIGNVQFGDGLVSTEGVSQQLSRLTRTQRRGSVTYGEEGAGENRGLQVTSHLVSNVVVGEIQDLLRHPAQEFTPERSKARSGLCKKEGVLCLGLCAVALALRHRLTSRDRTRAAAVSFLPTHRR